MIHKRKHLIDWTSSKLKLSSTKDPVKKVEREGGRPGRYLPGTVSTHNHKPFHKGLVSTVWNELSEFTRENRNQEHDMDRQWEERLH